MKQPFIQNISMFDIKSGMHPASDNAILLQITDPAFGFPTPVQPFLETHQFEFLDADDGFPEEALFTDEQATEIVSILRKALSDENDVIVHCHMGLCRSGSIAEIGVMMGFKDTFKLRQPNMRVKTKLLKALGWTYE